MAGQVRYLLLSFMAPRSSPEHILLVAALFVLFFNGLCACKVADLFDESSDVGRIRQGGQIYDSD